jgi:hypothetical protein
MSEEAYHELDEALERAIAVLYPPGSVRRETE